MKPEGVIQEIIKANLRGRGGGGFPTGWKWDSTRKATGRAQVRHLQRGRGGSRARTWTEASSREIRTRFSRG